VPVAARPNGNTRDFYGGMTCNPGDRSAYPRYSGL
jgi:hypothetical protein